METAIAELLAEAPVFVRNFEGEITRWSRGAEYLYGYSSEEAVGQDAAELLNTVFPAPLIEINSRLLKEGRWQGLLKQRRKDGQVIWSESQWRLRGASTDDPKKLLVVQTTTDVTACETLSHELQHRIKNIIAVVQGLAHMSLRSVTEKDAVKGFYGHALPTCSSTKAQL